MPSSPVDSPELRAALPAHVAERVISLRLAEDGTATVLIDVAGLTKSEREGVETDARSALMASGLVREIKVGLTADRAAPPPRPRIIAVGSGKGGVGKSTLSANLAVALARMGRKVGLVDADIYGPSQPRLLSIEGIRPEAEDKKLIPVMSPWGVPVLSMGNLVPAGQAIAWRGPMASGALGQLIDAEWGDVTDLIVDLPPGTGDVQITMLQKHRPEGAIVVSTPQDLALIDAERALALFGQGKIPVIGLVENMAGYLCPHCGKGSDPFGSGGAEAAAAAAGHAFLGRIPLTLELRTASDAGQPPAAGDGPEAEAFMAIARRVAAWLDGSRG